MLPVSQFIITIILVTGIVIIYSQMSFIKHKDLGYNKDVLLFLRINGNWSHNCEKKDPYSICANKIHSQSSVW